MIPVRRECLVIIEKLWENTIAMADASSVCLWVSRTDPSNTVIEEILKQINEQTNHTTF